MPIRWMPLGLRNHILTSHPLLRGTAVDDPAGCANASPRHQREHTPTQVFTRVSGVALGFRGQLGSNLFD